MKKTVVILSVIAMVCAFVGIPAAFAAPTVTLTVASSSPDSGVAVIVSPPDKNGSGNGTTQFTRSYARRTVVTLIAPATAGGNNFQKWQKNGVDSAVARTTTVTMKANTTMTAVYATPVTTSYTLTISSSNPASGVGVTVNPVDRNGQGNGTTQFSRSYNSGTTVFLTAPVTAGANAFQKWQKDGVDAAMTPATTVTMNAATTMTAVYANASGNPHASLTWTGYAMCLACHTDKAVEVQSSAHYAWEGPALSMVNGAPLQGKLKTAVNSYCGNIIGNWGGCSGCHIGVGKRPDDTTLTQQQHLENIDCLVCHQKDYKRKKDAITGLMFPDTANMVITMDQAVQTVHKPVRANCTQCHAKGGGGDNFKRGDMAVAHAATTDRNFDVHMSTTGADLVCQQCHMTQSHKIAGRGSDLRETDLDVKINCSTTACHPTKTAMDGHTTTEVNKHIARTACQTCHVKTYARDASDTAATEATETRRDWNTPEWSTTLNRWEPTVTLLNDQKPVYKFWNGTSWGYSLNDPATIDTATGRYQTSRPIGTVSGTDSSKIYPFKYKTTHRPYATDLGILIPMETKTYFSTGDPYAAIMSALNMMGYGNTEPYSWVDDDTYQLITHEVPPASGNVLTCTDCHISGTAAQIKLGDLGYAAKKPTSDLCNDCHSLRSYTSSYSSFISIHSRHVDSRQLKCSNCHNFERPERTNLR